MLDTGYGTGSRPTTARRRPEPADGAEPAEAPCDLPCDLVTVPARQGLEAVDILRLRHSVGPVLHDAAGDTLGFLVPPGTADDWDLPGSVCAPTHRRVGPLADPPVAGAGWLVPPESAHTRVTEPARLRAALGEAARTIAAAEGRVRGRPRSPA
ncbi:hypothetical protein [Streptomyces megasporus]|uniref:hypothetical protein n=1 Tax=Streptomyces megasporus TaxID=44060 RepID=UPI0004E11589